ncbi:FAD-dependent oxidoreductase [Streptomyces sp. NPDC101151]|uniref:FAD-dependent oxidoreductase n=1 Tax=Streptomyces sp. NPDC101151 TaxID=3366115 RepID=UPI003814091E
MSATSSFDVVVAGGGAAGIAAAVGARRAGADVLLVERWPFLGGASTISSVLTFCGFFDQRHEQVVAGVGAEVLQRLKDYDVYEELAGTSAEGDATHALADRIVTVDRDARLNTGWTGNHFVLLDLETTKHLYDGLVTEAGVTVRLHSTVTQAVRDDEGRVREITVNDRGGDERITASAFVDASGDGALLAAAGVGVRVEPASARQTSTLVCRVGGVAQDADLSNRGIEQALTLFAESTGLRFARTRGIAARLPVTGQIFLLLIDEQVDALDAAALTHSEMSARCQARQYMNAFRRHLPGWHGAHLVETGPQMGIRETRHLRGRASVTGDDVISGRKRPGDSIARCGWPIEDHAAPGSTRYQSIAGNGWYDIPYGAITSADTDNLWAAGRLTAADSAAYASLRVMGTAFATGHAAGVSAALYVHHQRHDIEAVRAELRRQDALI